MRVHTRVYEDDAVWVYDPDWDGRSIVVKPAPRQQRPELHLRALN